VIRHRRSGTLTHIEEQMIRHVLMLLTMLTLYSADVISQEQTTFRVIAVTLTTSAPAQLAIDRGRLVWRETDTNSGKLLFKYYWGQGILQLDSSLTGLTDAISGDHIAWNTSDEQVKSFDCRTWATSVLGPSYNPDFAQPVTVAGDLAAYARRNAGAGTSIVLHRFSTSHDTLLSEGTWNTWPSVHQGEVAWAVSDSESQGAASNIFFFDGRQTINVTKTTGVRNRSPLLRDGQIAWLNGGPGPTAVKLFTGDTTVTVAQSAGGSVLVAGYDLSDGVAVAALRDTASGAGTLSIYDSETRGTTTLSDSSGVFSPHISNGLVSWQSGSGPARRLHTYALATSLLQDVAGAENPVMDHDLLAWTYGDAVEMLRPVTFTQLTTDGQNGWEQTKFKTIDSGRAVWGNFANSGHARLFFSDGHSTRQLTDSAVTHDLIMANSGYVVWRSNFDSLYYFDGVHDPVKFVDTVQAENPYVAGGFISFHGLRLPEKTTIKHAWLYDITGGHLTQLTTDSSNTENVMCEGKTACWLNSDAGRLMFYDGNTTFPLSDSLIDSKYSYRNGTLVWCERQDGIMQVMMYNVTTKAKTVLTAGPPDKDSPITDGNIVIWYENSVFAGTVATGDMRYYDIGSRTSVLLHDVTHLATKWNWLSYGKIVWTVNGNVYQFDGSVVSQITGDDFNINTDAYLDRGTLIWQRTPPPPTGTNGQIYTEKLHAHAAFDAEGISGPVPLTTQFTDRSWEGASSYAWNFGDGATSNARNPSHTYLSPGKFTVTLTVSGPTGGVRERKYSLVRALSTTSASRSTASEPLRTELFQNYPNPFNPATSIEYVTAGPSHVRLEIFDVLGRRVATLVDGPESGGKHSVSWDASRNASGVYYYRLRSGNIVRTRSMLLLK
jgi:PKD repeat protein